MLKPCVMFAAVALAGLFAPLQNTTPANAPAYAIPPDAAQKPNPVKPTPASQTRAKQIFGYDCAICHGERGDGKGDLAGDMKTPMMDFRDPSSLKSMTDGEIYYVIEKGKGQMTPEEGRAKPDEIWNLVIYLRLLSKS